jgi:hypothetical protein
LLLPSTSSAIPLRSMMMLSSAVVSAFLVASVGAQNESGTSQTFTGFLTDMLCARLEIAPDGSNMIIEPVEHTVRCELLPACLRSGYGLAFGIGSEGDTLSRVGAVFDESGNDFVVDLLNSMDSATNDLRVKVTGTYLGTAPAADTPSISSRDGERFWPAMNNVPLITLDALEFCNYEGPDANFPKQDDVCSSGNILDLLATQDGRNTLANANLCMREEISLVSDDQNNIIVGHSGCADHATFQDVKRADAVSCSQTANSECDNVCEETDTCASECVDACGNPLVLASGAVAKSCCLDACGNPVVDPCGFPFLDVCGNPTLADGSICPAASVAENQANDCLDVCGNPIVDACGNPADQCCLDVCGNPLLDPCGFPWLDPCGNPAMNEAGDLCSNLGANVCLPSEDTCDNLCEATCASECVDVCGNPLVLASGAVAKSCCLDVCGNPVVDPCGFPFLDACGNPTLADGSFCPAASVAENEANDCLDVCGNPVVDACGNPVTTCCLDACGNPILDPCGFPWLDACGNPAMDSSGAICADLGENVCLPSTDCAAGDRECALACVDVCGNPLPVDISGRTASSCCLDVCGNPILDPCGFPFYDACGNPATADGSICPANSIAENEVNECVDVCGNPLTDVCGSPVESCCVDVCGNPVVDSCGFAVLDPCGNPLTAVDGDLCPAGQLGDNDCVDGGGWTTPVDGGDTEASEAPRDTEAPQEAPQDTKAPQDTEAPQEAPQDTKAPQDTEAPQEAPQDTEAPQEAPQDTFVALEGFQATALTGPLAGAVLQYRVNPQDAAASGQDTITIVLETPATGWVGFAFNNNGGSMIGSEAVIGLPDTGEVKKYDLLFKRESGVVPMDDTKQTLIDASVSQTDSGTTLRFTKILVEADEIPIASDANNSFLSAWGVDNTLAYHQARGPYELFVMSAPAARRKRNLAEKQNIRKQRAARTKGIRKTMIANHNKIEQSKILKSGSQGRRLEDGCHADCVDACGNPLPVDISGRSAKTCCLDSCGNPLLDACGFPFYDACGNPTSGHSGEACASEQIGESDHNECLDVCGSPIVDACGNPVAECCLDVCGNPLLDPCGFPWLDPCGNPASDSAGTLCTAQSTGENACLEDSDGGDCATGCADVCGNPLVLASGAVAKACCLDVCGNPLLDACGFPFYDPCGNPTSGYPGDACPAEQIAANDVNECVDGCGSPVVDACGSPVTGCCLDTCGNPILDPCGFPWLDACGNPAMDASGGVCANLGENVCLGGDDDDTCSPASVFPPATGSFQCEGLVSPCMIAMDGVSCFCVFSRFTTIVSRGLTHVRSCSPRA